MVVNLTPLTDTSCNSLFNTTILQQQQILLKIGNITNSITFPPEAGGAEDILQVQGLYIDGLNNSEDLLYSK